MDRAEKRQHLLKQAREGDESALEQLLWDHVDELTRGLAPQMPDDLKSLVTVEDVLQQTFYEAFRDFGQFRDQPGGSFAAWLKTIATHRLLDAIRKLRKGDVARGIPDGAQLSACQDLIDLVPDTASRASVVAQRWEAEHALRLALENLTEDSRQVLILRYVQDIGIDEIAEQMGRSRGSVRGLLDRAKLELRGVLESYSRFLSGR